MHRAGIAHLPPGNGFWESGGLHPPSRPLHHLKHKLKHKLKLKQKQNRCVYHRAGVQARELAGSCGSAAEVMRYFSRRRAAGTDLLPCFRGRGVCLRTPAGGREELCEYRGLRAFPPPFPRGSRLSEKRMKKPGKSRPPAAKRLTLGGFHAIISATVPGGDGAANREEKGCRFR